jgi:hypothetical protein
MLKYLRGKASDRKFRLFACACCRLIWHLLPSKSNRDLVVAFENYPEAGAAIVTSSSREDLGYVAVKCLWKSFYDYKHSPSDWAISAAAQVAVKRMSKECVTLSGDARREVWRKAFLREWPEPWLVRCVFGNPFRPSTLHPSVLSWNEGTVVRLAQAVYQDRRFEDLPVLADALEEAGCTDPEILAHCRGGGDHGRGCWVVDTILGKT